MAISLVGTLTTGTATNGGNVTITLPSGLAQDDVVYVFVAVSDLNTGAAAVSGGWTAVVAALNEGVSSRAACYRKVMGSSPDTTFEATGSGNAADSAAAVAVALRGVDLTTPEDATPTTAIDGTGSTNPNCPSITTVTDGAWVLALAQSRVNDASIVAPTGYSNLANVVANDETDDTSIAGSTKLVATAGAEDPDAYTTWSSGRWITATVAVRPAAGGAGGAEGNFGMVIG